VTRERLGGLYPGGLATLEVGRRPQGGAEAHISLPYHVGPPEDPSDPPDALDDENGENIDPEKRQEDEHADA